MKLIYFYELYADGPAGNYPIGYYTTKLKADKAKAEWDAKHTHDWDKARISSKRTLNKNIIKFDGSVPY